MKIYPLSIKDLTITTPTVLAPMAGFSDLPFRKICRKFNCGLVISELISSEGIIREANASLEYLTSDLSEQPVGAQIFGTDAARMAEVAINIEKLNRFSLIDINAGCPVPKLMKKGAGASLMKNPENIGKIISAVSDAVDLPVTLKTRIGLKDGFPLINEVANAVESNGGKALTIHGRYAENHHKGNADWELIAKIKEQLNIPVIGNGGINCAQDAIDMLKHTKVDAVMIGRAAIGNPWIFQEIFCKLNNLSFIHPNNEQRREIIIYHLNELINKFKNSCRRKNKNSNTYEISACRKFRPQMIKYLSGYQGVHKLSAKLDRVNNLKDVIEGIDFVLQHKIIQ